MKKGHTADECLSGKPKDESAKPNNNVRSGNSRPNNGNKQPSNGKKYGKAAELKRADAIIASSNSSGNTVKGQPLMRVKIRKNDQSASEDTLVLADTGCTDNCISEDLANKCDFDIEPSTESLRVADGRKLQILGSTSFVIAYEGYAMKIRAIVLKNLNNRFYLSETTLKDFGILPVEFPHLPPDNYVNLRPSNRRYRDPHASTNGQRFVRELRGNPSHTRLENTADAQIQEVSVNCIVCTDVINDYEKSKKILKERFNRDGKIYTCSHCSGAMPKELIDDYLKYTDCTIENACPKSRQELDHAEIIRNNQNHVAHLRSLYKRKAPHRGRFRQHSARRTWAKIRALSEVANTYVNLPRSDSNHDFNEIQCSEICFETDIGLVPLSVSGKLHEVETLQPKVRTSITKDDSTSIRNEIEKMITEKFSDVFNDDQTLRPLKTSPLRIHVREDAKPFAVTGARPIPIAYRQGAKAEMDYMEERGIIKKIKPGDPPSEWICPSFFLTKANGKLRFVIDLRGLNRNVVRSAHPFPPASEVFTSIPYGMKYFAVFDAVKGYWQLPVAEEDQKFLHFMTPFGVYKFLRAPMGLVHSGDEYCLRGDQIFSGVEGVLKIVDDLAVYGKTKEEFLVRVRRLFERCHDHNFTLSREKFQCGPEVNFAGYIIGQYGVRADPKKLEALTKFPRPETVTDVRAFYGLVNQLGGFCPDLSHALEPLRDILRTKKEKEEAKSKAKINLDSTAMTPSTLPSTNTPDELAAGKLAEKPIGKGKKGGKIDWKPTHQAAFENVIRILTEEHSPALGYFDPHARTVVITDASRLGFGAVLLQYNDKEPERHRLIQCFSKCISDAESRYAVCELEATGIQYAIANFRLWLEGNKFEVWTDHAPLVNIYNGSNLDAQRNVRLQRIVSKTAHLTFEVKYLKGSVNKIADALSRRPVFAASDAGDILLEDGKFVNAVSAATEEIESPSAPELTNWALSDDEYQKIVELLKKKIKSSDIPPGHPASHYRNMWDFLSIIDGLIHYHDRIVVPKNARRTITDLLHTPHLGTRKTKDLARSLYYWPAMNKEIDDRTTACEECAKKKPSKPMEPLRTTTASFPWEQTSSDLATYNGKKFLVYADRYSGWPLIAEMKGTTASHVIKKFEEWFAEYGLCTTIRTDGGPPYNSHEFAKFVKDHGITHETSSAGYPRSNGHAEANVKIVKSILEKSRTDRDVQRALREFRNTPRDDGLSPAQWLFGRRQRTLLPANPQAYARVSDERLEEHERLRVLGADRKRKKTGTTRTPFEFVKGDIVRVQDLRTGRWTNLAKVIGLRNEGRSAIVLIDGDDTPRLRNRTKLHFVRHEGLLED